MSEMINAIRETLELAVPGFIYTRRNINNIGNYCTKGSGSVKGWY